jgi:hypothetical protein
MRTIDVLNPARDDQWDTLVRMLAPRLDWTRAMLHAWLASFLGCHPEIMTARQAEQAIEELVRTTGFYAAVPPTTTLRDRIRYGRTD